MKRDTKISFNLPLKRILYQNGQRIGSNLVGRYAVMDLTGCHLSTQNWSSCLTWYIPSPEFFQLFVRMYFLSRSQTAKLILLFNKNYPQCCRKTKTPTWKQQQGTINTILHSGLLDVAVISGDHQCRLPPYLKYYCFIQSCTGKKISDSFWGKSVASC